MPGDVSGSVLQAEARFGHAIASLGDVNGDGIPDFVVGAPRQSMSDLESGQAFVISGSDGLRIRTLDIPQLDSTMFANFGWAVAGLGDVNGDGIPDIAVAAPFQEVTHPTLGLLFSVGRVFVFSGADGEQGGLLYWLDNPGTTLEELDSGSFGYALAAVGDLDGDGVRDLAVGAPTVGAPTAPTAQEPRSQGRVFVFSGATGTLLRVLDNPTPPTTSNFFAFFGGAVAGVGDLNADGVEDIAVGAPEQDRGRGRVFVFSGALGTELGHVDPAGRAGPALGDRPELWPGLPVFAARRRHHRTPAAAGHDSAGAGAVGPLRRSHLEQRSRRDLQCHGDR